MNILRKLKKHATGNVGLRSTSSDRAIGFATLDADKAIEEQTMPAYAQKRFYPMRLGEILHSRYRIITKLGFGANSTVWLCHDLQKGRHLALKVYIHSAKPVWEPDILQCLAAIDSKHPGRSLVRQMVDAFEVVGPNGRHSCLVHQPLLMSLQHFQFSLPEKSLTEDMLKGAVDNLLQALDYLHSEAEVVHTDIQAKNLILSSRDASIFSEWAKAEELYPSPRKEDGNYIVYQTRPVDVFDLLKKHEHIWGPLVLCDFGEARKGKRFTGLVQPDLFRAPEVILGMEWTSKADIWNMGVMIWRLFQDHHLFENRNTSKLHSDDCLLAHIIAILGTPPAEFLKRSTKCQEFWDKDGRWRGSTSIPDDSLEDSEEYLEGENKDLFLRFMYKMLKWIPEQWYTAKELLQDPWLNSIARP